MQGSSFKWASVLVAASLGVGGCIAVVEPESGEPLNEAPYDDEVDLGYRVDALRSCPSSPPAGARAAATLALQISAAYAAQYGAEVGDSMLSSQFYRLRSGGGIELQRAYAPKATSSLDAIMNVAQEHPDVAAYLRGGLVRCQTYTNGKNMATVVDLSVAAAKVNSPSGSEKLACSVGTCVTRFWTSYSWCQQRAVSLTREVSGLGTAPIEPLSLLVKVRNRSTWSSMAGFLDTADNNYTNTTNNSWCSPFDGPNAQNPYLFAHVSGAITKSQMLTSVQSYTCTSGDANCTQSPTIQVGMEIDPAPYVFASNSTTMNSAGQEVIVGTSTAYPYNLEPTYLTAHANHRDKWAKRSDGKFGRFMTARVIGDTTTYKWACVVIPGQTCP
jgi:hypothetical protein